MCVCVYIYYEFLYIFLYILFLYIIYYIYFIYFIFILYILWIFVYVPVWIYVHLYMKMLQVRRGCQSLWRWHFTWLRAARCGRWEPNSGSLEEEQALWTAEASLQPWCASHFLQWIQVFTILGTTHSTGVTTGKILQLRYFLQGCFRGPGCLLPTLLSSYPLWIWNVNALDFSVIDSRQSNVLVRHNQTFSSSSLLWKAYNMIPWNSTPRLNTKFTYALYAPYTQS